jgi:hypothetical protein
VDYKASFLDSHQDVVIDFIRNDFYRIFMPHLTEIGKLMKDQLTAANDAGYRVQVGQCLNEKNGLDVNPNGYCRKSF